MKRTFYFLILVLFCFVLTTIKVHGVTAEGESAFTLQYSVVEVKEKIEFKAPKFDWVPLDEELMEYIYKTCGEYGISFPLFMGVLDVETGGTFDTKLVSKTNDRGLTQINKRYQDYHCESVGINPDTFDVFNPYDSVLLSVNLLSDLKQEYYKKYSGKSLDIYSLGCYNRGRSAMEDRKNINTEYSEKVFKASEKYK